MNKIKQNKITFTLILSSIVIVFSSLTILSLPVLFNYKSKVTIIEKNYYKSFKIYLNSYGKILYKPFPKPHLVVENASLNLNKNNNNDRNNLVKTSDLKIFISLRDIYLRSFDNILATEISNSNIDIQFSDIKNIRKHLYQNINKQIIFNNCKIFVRNKAKEVILISPIKKISYKINEKSKLKNFKINGKIFGLDYKSEWKREYLNPNKSFHNINLYNPNIDISNILEFEDQTKFKLATQILYSQDKLAYDIEFNNNEINIQSKLDNSTNYKINSKIKLKPFYFEGDLTIRKRKIEKLIDNILLSLYFYDKNLLGNINGLLKIKFDELNNKLIKKGYINFYFNEKKIFFKEAKFELDKIGNIKTTMNFEEDNGEIKFLSKNHLIIKDHIEFAKIFQISSKKVKDIKNIYFDLQKDIGATDFVITNVKINNFKNNENQEDVFLVKNIQNLRSYLRKIIN